MKWIRMLVELEEQTQVLEAAAKEPGLSEDERFERRRASMLARHELLMQRNLAVLGRTVAKTAANVEVLAESVRALNERMARLEQPAA